MLKQINMLELKINERNYQFLCQLDSPIPDIKEAIFQFQKFIGHVEDGIKAAQAQIAQSAPVPDIKVEGDQNGNPVAN